MVVNGLPLNPEKCESLIFRRTNSKYNQTEEEKINFLVDGTLIEPSATSKLGVHIDERLNQFNNHQGVQYARRSLSRSQS